MTPRRGGILVTSNQRVKLTLVPNAVAEQVTVDYVRRLPAEVSAPVPANSEVIQDYTLTVRRQNNAVATQFAKPYTMTISYSAGQLAARRIDEASLSLLFLDSQKWVSVPSCTQCGVDMVNKQVTAVLDHFTEFILVGNVSPWQTYLPIISK